MIITRNFFSFNIQNFYSNFKRRVMVEQQVFHNRDFDRNDVYSEYIATWKECNTMMDSLTH